MINDQVYVKPWFCTILVADKTCNDKAFEQCHTCRQCHTGIVLVTFYKDAEIV